VAVFGLLLLFAGGVLASEKDELCDSCTELKRINKDFQDEIDYFKVIHKEESKVIKWFRAKQANEENLNMALKKENIYLSGRSKYLSGRNTLLSKKVRELEEKNKSLNTENKSLKKKYIFKF